MTWPCRTLAPGRDAVGEARTGGVGRHVAVGVLDLDPAPVARIPVRLDDGAVAGATGSACRCGWPSRRPCASSNSRRIGWWRVAEARAQDAVGDRLAQQELLQRRPLLVEEVDRAVLALVAEDAPRLAADRQGRVEDLRRARVRRRPAVEDLERVAGETPGAGNRRRSRRSARVRRRSGAAGRSSARSRRGSRRAVTPCRPRPPPRHLGSAPRRAGRPLLSSRAA